MKCPRLSLSAMLIVGLSLILAASTAAVAADAPIQSWARPFGLDIVNKVQLAGSDVRAADFQANTLPGLSRLSNASMKSGISIPNFSMIQLDPSKLTMTTATNARVYFVGEGAGYHNTLGFNTTGTGIDSGDPKLIFPDASTGRRLTSSTPLSAGDYVELGTIEAGAQLDFFLIADGASSPRGIYSTNKSANPDGIDHVVAYASADSPYLLIGFEDMFGGGDQDYNDLLFVVDVGAENVGGLPGVPEPAMGYVLLSFLGIGLFLRRKNRQPGRDTSIQ